MPTRFLWSMCLGARWNIIDHNLAVVQCLRGLFTIPLSGARRGEVGPRTIYASCAYVQYV